jgi:hypothetical protein
MYGVTGRRVRLELPPPVYVRDRCEKSELIAGEKTNCGKRNSPETKGGNFCSRIRLSFPKAPDLWESSSPKRLFYGELHRAYMRLVPAPSSGASGTSQNTLRMADFVFLCWKPIKSLWFTLRWWKEKKIITYTINLKKATSDNLLDKLLTGYQSNSLDPFFSLKMSHLNFISLSTCYMVQEERWLRQSLIW